MKYIKPSAQLVCLALLLLSLQGCTGDFARINENCYEVDKEELGRENYNIGSTLKTLQGMVVPTQEHLHQFYEILAGAAFSGYAGSTPDGWKAKYSTYNPPEDWLRGPFVTVFEKTYPAYRDMFDQTEDPVAIALARLMRVAIMHRATDTYGPIPYSKVISPTGKVSLSAPYDTQEEVYTQMFKELDEVDAVLRENSHLSSEAFRKFDDVFYGNIAQWMRYLHSLQLRMAMRLSYVKPELARQVAEKAVAAGVITANTDNALLKVEENRSAMIWNDWNDHRMGAEIINYMNAFNDPRRESMFTKVKTKDPVTSQPVNGFEGMRIGDDPYNKEMWVNSFSKPIITDTDPFLWMNAAEVSFLRAEGALRGWAMGGEAKTFYNQGIALSFEQHGASGADAYCQDNTSQYPTKYTPVIGLGEYKKQLTNITVKWEEGAQFFERNLERIILQKWIALFPLSIEAWSEFRRTGYPKLMPVLLNKSGGVIPEGTWIRRLPYPSEEYRLNNTNVTAALDMLGGPDNGGTRLWWDCKP